MGDTSDTDSAEDVDKLKEAVVDGESIIKSSLTKPSVTNTHNLHDALGSSHEVTQKPSLRLHKQDDEEHELKTTPEFRQHVASHLNKLLDRDIEVIQGNVKFGSPLPSASTDSGFRLFSTSVGGVDEAFSYEEHNSKARKKRNLQDSSDSDEEESRLLAAAVSGTDILSQSAIHKKPCIAMAMECDKVTEASVDNHNGAQQINKKCKKRKKKKSKEK